MQRYKVYGGNLRTLNLSVEQQKTMISASAYAFRFNYSLSSVYYGIAHGYIVAKKFRGRWYLLPLENEKTKIFM